jgi:hypothetical protein
LERGQKVYFRESKNVAIEMTLNQGRLVHAFIREKENNMHFEYGW